MKTFLQFVNESMGEDIPNEVNRLYNEIKQAVSTNTQKFGNLSLEDYFSWLFRGATPEQQDENQWYIWTTSIHDLDEYNYGEDYTDEDNALSNKTMQNIVKNVSTKLGFNIDKADENSISVSKGNLEVVIALVD